MLCCVMLCYVKLCYVIWCYVVVWYVLLCFVVLYFVMLCCVILCYVILCRFMLCYVILCPFMLCCVMLGYFMVCYVVSWSRWKQIQRPRPKLSSCLRCQHLGFFLITFVLMIWFFSFHYHQRRGQYFKDIKYHVMFCYVVLCCVMLFISK